MNIQVQVMAPDNWQRLLGYRIAMEPIAKRLHTSVILNYMQQQTPSALPWQQSKRAQKDGSQTLIDPGRMFASLTYQIGEDWAEIGYPNGDIARWLHFGVPKNNLVPREQLGMRDDDTAKIHAIVKHYFEMLLR